MITKQGLCKALLYLPVIGVLFLSHSVFAGSWQNNQSLGGFNKVNIYTPDSNSSIGQGKALMIVLHGCVQSVDAYLTANLESAAENHGMIIAVPDAMNKAGFSCWSYWQGTKSRNSGDYKNLIALANTLTGDNNRGIDPNQVYIAGLSSGAAFANTTACLAPDIFAGMGISAGPSIGTSSNGALGPCEAANVQARCQQYAGSYSSHFSNQIASIAQGDQDSTVNLCYNTQNAEGMADLYNVSELPGSNTISEGAGRTGDETLWQDGRVSRLWFNGVDHAWSGGQGASGAYISGSGINYAEYLGQYFATNNQRVDRNTGPVLSNIQVGLSGSQIVVSGNAQDAGGTVAQVSASFAGVNGGVNSATGSVDSAGNFVLTSAALADDLYQVSLLATDNEGKDSVAYNSSIRVGPPPAPAAPVLSNILVSVSGQCATVSGNVVDTNDDLASVSVAFANGNVTAAITQTSYSATQCSLPGGSNTASVTASDQAAQSSSDSITFNIDAGQTATLSQHINAGRLDYTNYANCYLEYSTSTFKLFEESSGASQCLWQDNDASCTGPVQACSGSGSGSGSGGGSGGGSDGGSGDETCVEHSTYNYYHKTSGRAYSSGNPYTPNYFAQGSDQAMSGSTYGVNTLYSTDNVVWTLGTCP
jgi:poly(hydroxyalkanoate) depolymerase family esterase